jgi:hypothetical protein
LRLIKSIEVEDTDIRQTLLIFPVTFMALHSPQHIAQFQELGGGQMLVRLAGPTEALLFKSYKLVTSHSATWSSIPRAWLRNQGARKGDWLDIFTTPDPRTLMIQFRKAPMIT